MFQIEIKKKKKISSSINTPVYSSPPLVFSEKQSNSLVMYLSSIRLTLIIFTSLFYYLVYFLYYL